MTVMELWNLIRPWWLVWMVVLFLVIVFWAYRPRNRKRFERDGDIPFREENGG